MSKEFIDKIMMIPYEYGGRTEDGIDCWGLVVMAYRDIFGIHVPSYEDTAWSVSNTDTTAEDIQRHLEESAPFIEVDTPRYGDFVLLSILGHPIHIGFMMDGKHMIHTSSKVGTALENIGGIKWKRRIKGFYRHLDLI